ncbi:glycosyltransferase involved in cell wall biosynthesis [Acinetobacter johnsonii]|uniref:glycosyltransferase n=1 Tax=Acinetobacter johnsonii TaxID=40214 RepID=UPI001613C40C|nr:glycosyltransferase [Acinetobacter johnsonii]MBB4810271.1 glycosyltransferase involved in cell wall biosynthesis [Acinetobacter johnsonii]
MYSIRIVLLSSASSIHTIQWAKYLVEQGLDIHVISQHEISSDWPKNIPVTLLPHKGFIGYYLNIFALRKILEKIQPELVNVHYASGYGTTARLINFHPYVLSVWGSDVYEFPFRSFIHKYLLQKNLKSADTVASTSLAMSEQTKKFLSADQSIVITPFGVDFSKFKKNPKSSVKGLSSVITIGTVKTLKHVYGIDVLIHALAKTYNILKQHDSEGAVTIQFRIVGGGPDLEDLQELAKQLGIEHLLTFVGQVEHEQVPIELEKLDIYVALSRQESFGVAVLEAQAMGLPVIVSDVGGLPEVVQQGKTGFIVESENSDQAAQAIVQLILDRDLRERFGVNAEHYVRENFSWQSCAGKMKNVYQNTLANFNEEHIA